MIARSWRRAIEEESSNPAIGLLLGAETKTERFTLTGLAALSCENFGAAVHQMARYKQLTCPEEVLQHKHKGDWSIQFRWLLAEEAEPLVLIECAFAYLLSIARHGTGNRKLSPLRVEFVEPRSHIKTVERHFGCEIVCGTERNAIVFRVSDKETPFMTRNAELLAVLAPQFERELAEDERDENFVERVRLAVQQHLTGRRPTIGSPTGAFRYQDYG